MKFKTDSQIKSYIGISSLLMLVVIGASQIPSDASSNVSQGSLSTDNHKNSSLKSSELTKVSPNTESSSVINSEVSSSTKSEGGEMIQSTTTSINGGVAEVTVNGESVPVPTDGSTVTQTVVGSDGSGNTVISVSGTSSSAGNTRNSNMTSINTSIRSSNSEVSGESFSTDSGP